MKHNFILQTDSYKLSMPGATTGDCGQWPPDTTGLYAYVESRGGKYPTTLFCGLQPLLIDKLSGVVFSERDIAQAAAFASAHGEPFNEQSWRDLLAEHGGALPVRIKAVAEGTVMPTHNVMATIEATDPRFFWLVSWLETSILRAIWYSTTVATQSYHIKQTILGYLRETSENPDTEILFKLHDFGARGVSSAESASLGGMAHLFNFLGSDTIEGILAANEYYSCPMAGFSIAASEHSTITSWGKAREIDAYRNMLNRFAKPGALVACVSDSYDLYNAIEKLWGDALIDKVRDSGATLVIRPDSGDPASVVLRALNILESKFGAQYNGKGYKQLPQCVRLIQGDGINHFSIEKILHNMKEKGFSASNIAFGMGGALLQGVNRDTLKFAYKTSEATVDGKAVPVFKDPVTDPGKRSKSGRLSLIRSNGVYATVSGSSVDGDLLQTVFENGEIKKIYTMDEVRANTIKGIVNGD
jgi:nicotinamide phosphoribosyltransferase